MTVKVKEKLIFKIGIIVTMLPYIGPTKRDKTPDPGAKKFTI